MNPNLRAGDYRISYTSRGSERDRDEVRGSDLVKVYLRGFEVNYNGKITYIPFHRVLEVKNEVTGEILYSRRKP
ncbi:MAG: hypothetical protein QXY49_01965 [Thermofilaceae archaeon]